MRRDAASCPVGIHPESERRVDSLRLGFVDAHTHPIWAGDRVHEYARKVRSVQTVPFPTVLVRR